MEVKKFENRQEYLCVLEGVSYIRTEIDWYDERPLQVNWRLNEDYEKGKTYPEDDELEQLFWESNCKPNIKHYYSENGDILYFNDSAHLTHIMKKNLNMDEDIETEVIEKTKSKLTFGEHSTNKANEVIQFCEELISFGVNIKNVRPESLKSDTIEFCKKLIDKIIVTTVGSEGDIIYCDEVLDKIIKN